MTGWYIALKILYLASFIALGSTQTTCYRNPNFICEGDGELRGIPQQCCDAGFLTYTEFGSDVCQLCGNVICSASNDCSDPFATANTLNRADCCATAGGVAYQDSSLRCRQCPSAIMSCNTELSCRGDSIPLTSTGAAAQVRECCVDTAGLSYNILGQCRDCTVYGFFQTELAQEERGQGYPIEIGFLKRAPFFTMTLRGTIDVAPGGTAGFGRDFQLSSNRFTVSRASGQGIIVTYRVDSIAQEPVETARLLINAPTIPGVITRGSLDLIITDNDFVEFRLTETAYRSSENDLQINAEVSKNLRIANPVTFLLTPYTVAQAEAVPGLVLENVPADDNPRAPNRAQISLERQDFNSSVISVMFEADEIGPQVNDVPVPVPIFDDSIDEAQEEVFIIDLTLDSSINDKIVITRRSSLCSIIDNDELKIGFQNFSYTFPEPEFETEIFGVVFLEKEGSQITEQTYVVIIEVSKATPNTNILAATLADGVNDNDYVVTTPNVQSFVLEFEPQDQLLDFSFLLYPDEIAEGTEAFQGSSQPSKDPLNPAFSAPTTLFPSTFIVIADDDSIIVGLEQNYTVSEDIGTFEACFRVINPPDGYDFSLNVDLIGVTVAGSALAFLDYNPIGENDPQIPLSGGNRRSCLDVLVFPDNVYEGTEQFSLSLQFDPFLVDKVVRSQVTIEPSVVYVDIQDVTELEIGFIDDPYSGNEADRVITFEVGVTNGVQLGQNVGIEFSTADVGGISAKNMAIAGIDYTVISGKQLIFGPGNLRMTVDVVVNNDNAFELTELFGGRLSANGALERFSFSSDFANASILNDDASLYFGGCFSSPGCTTGPVSAVSAEDCCVDNPDGMYFMYEGQQCLQCIVYGWGSPNFTRAENQVPYDIPLAYFKGPSDVSMIVDIVDTGLGTAERDVDYTENDYNAIFLSLDPTGTTSVTFKPDNLALEPDETIVFNLNMLSFHPSTRTENYDAALPNVFFQQQTFLSIQDSTELVFWLRELSREVDEDSGAVPVRVSGGHRGKSLASEISLLLTPKVAPVGYMSPDSHSYSTKPANAHPGRLDFSPQPIKVTFPVGRTRNVVVDVPIIDDDINEALEYFIVELSFADPASVPDTVSIRRNFTRCDIVDNDDIYIGFLLPDTTYPEVEAGHSVTLIKGGVTEQKIFAVVNLVQTVPPGSGFDIATPSAGGYDNDLAFGGPDNSFLINFAPDINTTTVRLTIFGDDQPENTEATQLTIEALTEEIQTGVIKVLPPYFNILPEFSNFFFIILDDDFICQELFPLTNGRIVFTPNTTAPYLEGTNAEHICNPGFSLIGNVIRVCQNDSTFSGVMPMCIPIQCEPLHHVNNGDITYAPDQIPNYYLGTVAIYSCDEGFVLNFSTPNASATRTCVDDMDNDAKGIFDGKAPICIPIQCRVLPVFPNGFITYSKDIEADFDFGTVATYGCDDGFSLVGDDMRNCTTGVAGRSVGAWTGIGPTCVPVQCPPLPGITNGVVFYVPNNAPNYDLGTKAVYICNEGYALNISTPGSSEIRTCVDDLDKDAEGVFDRLAPSCEIATAGVSAPREVHRSCLGFAIILRWRPPSPVVGVISRYEIKFSDTRETINKNGEEHFHLFPPNMFDSKVTVQVRAHTDTDIVGRWSDPLEIGC